MMDQSKEPRQVIADLSASVWAFSALASAVELGLLDQIAGPRSLANLSEQIGVEARLVEPLLDVLAALGLLRREGDAFSAAPGLLPLLGAKDVLLAELRSTYLQSWQAIQDAKAGRLGRGWVHIDPELLQAQGRSGQALTQMMAQQVFPMMPGLEARLQAPTAAFLDVGTGVGVIAIELCRHYPQLRAVGLEPHPPSLAEARRNVAAAHLEERIELRAQRVEELADRETYDLAYLPGVFMPAEIYRHGLRTVFRALRPGGWVSLVAISAPGQDLEASLARLRNVLWGGEALTAEQVAEMAREAGFTAVQIGGAPGSSVKGIMAQRPA